MAHQSNQDHTSSDRKDSRVKPATNYTGTLKRQTTTTVLIAGDRIQFYDDDFVRIRALGEPGTFGMVYESYRKDDPHKTLYAVKRMSKRRDSSETQKIKREIDIMQKLKNHQYICTLHDVLEDRSHIHLVLDHLSGGELYVRIQEMTELPESMAQTICNQICLGVQHMHNMGIAHLDLKTDNIMFVNSGVDSIKFMAPEIINATESTPYDPLKADIWSIGIVTFCMLFGFQPFFLEDDPEGDPQEAIYELIKKGFTAEVKEGWGAFFPSEIEVSDDVRDLIKQMLEYDAECRPSVDECLDHEWLKRAPESSDTKPEAPRLVVTNGPMRSDEDLNLDEYGAGSPHSLQSGWNMSKLIEEDPLTDYETSDEDTSDDDDEVNLAKRGVIKKGYLKKEGKIWKSWKRRYFILDSHGELYYYKNEKTIQEKIHSFDISRMTKKPEKISLRSGGQFGILLETNGRNWKFVCSDEEDRKSWMKAFAKAKKAATTNRDLEHNIDHRVQRGSLYEDNRGKMSPIHLNHIPTSISLTNMELEQAITDMIKSQKLSSKEAAKLRQLDRKVQLGLIQNHKSRQLNKKKGLRVPTTPQVKALTAAILQSQTSISRFDEQDLDADPFGKIPSDLNLDDHTHFKKERHSKQSSIKRLSASASVAQQTRALKRRQAVEAISPFKAKHCEIIKVLMDAIGRHEESVVNDEGIMECVGALFVDSTKMEEKEMEECLSSPGSQLSRDRSMNYNPLHSKSSPKSESLKEEESESGPRFVCRSLEDIMINSELEVIAFILQEMWGDDEASKTLYQQLLKLIPHSHWRAKMFAVAIDRRDQYYNFKKYKQCFLGNEGIDCLISLNFVDAQSVDHRERSRDVLNSWMTRGYIHHVTKEHKYKDEPLFYTVDDAVIDRKLSAPFHE